MSSAFVLTITRCLGCRAAWPLRAAFALAALLLAGLPSTGHAQPLPVPGATVENFLVIAGKQVPLVLMGDAAATGHFSIGSGSRLAFGSAIALAEYLHFEPTLQGAFERYQDERRVEVLRLQSAARNSLEWFEEVERYLDLPPFNLPIPC